MSAPEQTFSSSARTQAEAVLVQGVSRLGLDLPGEILDRLLVYLELLAKWNRVYNLTAVRDPVQMVIRHLLDSFAVLPHVAGKRFIDVGTGAGLPGIPLAVALADTQWVLLDANGKKARFVTQAVAAAGLTNVSVAHARVEDYHPAHPFDAVVTRAYASLEVMVASTRHLCGPHGRILAMKGRLPGEEIRRVKAMSRVVRVHELTVPGLTEERCLVEVLPDPVVSGGGAKN